MNAIILHGKPEKEEYFSKDNPSESNSHWLPWLQKQLIVNGIKADTPEVPNSYDPDWQTWVTEVERFPINDQTILIGHSCGGGFWLKYLSQNKEVKLKKLILVAPWLDPDGDETKGFFDNFEIDKELTNRTPVIIFNSDNDMGNVIKSVAQIREVLPAASYKEFKNYGHFCYGDMQTNEFPELLETCL